MKKSLPRFIPGVTLAKYHWILPFTHWIRTGFIRLVIALVVALAFRSSAPAAEIIGGSALLSSGDAQQIETWLGQGGITLTNVFTSVPGDGKTANDFHQVADGIGSTIVVIEVPAQSGYARKVIGAYNPQSWDSLSNFHYTFTDAERTAFLFNLSTGALYRQKLNDVDGGTAGIYQTYNDFSYGPTFGGGSDIYVDFGLHNGFTYGWSYGPSGFGGSILGGGEGDDGVWLNYGIVEVFALGLGASAPKATTLDADNVSSIAATLNATVSANLLETDVIFQYSTDPTFATGTLTTLPQTLPGNAFGTLVSKTVSDLVPESSYYFRVVATNSVGTATGDTLSFFATDSAVGYRFSRIADGNTGSIGNTTIGSKFSVKSSCTLTHLGVYDHNQDGLAADTPVGLWNASGDLVASTTVLSNDPLNRSCRYHQLSTPVVLAANAQYFIGAFFPSGEVYGYQPPTFVTDSRVTFAGFAYRFGSFACPNEFTGSEGDGFIGYFGANFLIEAAVKAPIAAAGPDQNVDAGDAVTLDGSASYDRNTPPRALSYSWNQAGGPGVSLTDANTATPTFTAPTLSSGGAALVFKLTVSNGLFSSSDFVTVNVANVNHPPIANAGPEQTVGESTMVTLNASLSSDSDGDALTIQWSQVSGPAVQLDDPAVASPIFLAPSVTAAQGSVDLGFQLVVNDGKVSSGPATVIVHVKNTNDGPTANAGVNQSVNELDQVTLNGSASSDPDSDTLSYSWTQILGEPLVVLTGANSATPHFQAPALDFGGASEGTTLTFQLTVSDGILSDTAAVNVRVSNVNHAPIADAGSSQTVPQNTQVTLNGANSADVDGDPLTFAWVQTEGPTVVLTGSQTAAATFTAPSAGVAGTVLKFKLTVSDEYGGTATDETVVNVTYVNRPPTANAGAAQIVNEGDIVNLGGTASDPDGNALAISWSQVSGPTVTLVDGGTLTPSFSAPAVTIAGADVTLRLSVDDNYGGKATSDVSVHVVNVNHAPSAQAPGNLSVIAGASVNLVGEGSDPDPEEQSQLTYAWHQVSGPAVSLSGTGASVSFTAPLETSTLVFRLTVTDPSGAVATDDVDVIVTNGDHAPIALAGGNLTVNEGASATLNGSASNDPDGNTLTFAWEQTRGPAVVLNDANTAFPYFRAPYVGASGAILTFKLTVGDGSSTSSDTANVTVVNVNDPPTVGNARPSVATLWPPDHSMTKVSILGVSDINNNATISITAVEQDEPTNGLADGDTPVDAIISADRTSVLLRAERSGKGDGRVYLVHFTASDYEGTVSGIVTVSVPKNKKTDRAVNSGAIYKSTR